jgi:hypothetical protein
MPHDVCLDKTFNKSARQDSFSLFWENRFQHFNVVGTPLPQEESTTGQQCRQQFMQYIASSGEEHPPRKSSK